MLATAAALALSVSPVLAQAPTAPAAKQVSVPQTPADFATVAASSNMLEIESSKVALQNAKSDEVKQFAQQMIDDHTKAGEEMMSAAQKDGITETPRAMTAKHQAKMTELNASATGDTFDATYIALQTEAHEEAVALFKSYAGKPGALGEFAGKTLPTLEQHLEHVRKLKM